MLSCLVYRGYIRLRLPSPISLKQISPFPPLLSPNHPFPYLAMSRKMLIRQRKRVTRSDIRPAMMCGGMRKDVHDTTTKRPDGM